MYTLSVLPRFLKWRLFFASPWNSWFGGYETSVECHQLFDEIVQVLNYVLHIGILHLHELIRVPDISTVINLNYMMLLLVIMKKYTILHSCTCSFYNLYY